MLDCENDDDEDVSEEENYVENNNDNNNNKHQQTSTAWTTTTTMMIMSVTNFPPHVCDNLCSLVACRWQFLSPFWKVTAGVEEDANFANCFSPLLLQPNPSHDDHDHDHDDYS